MHWNVRVKVQLLALAGATVVLFARVGYAAIPRVDPQGAFVLGNVVEHTAAALLLLGLVAVTTLVGTLWLHRDLPGAAWLMIGAGWMGLALRSWPIESRLIVLQSGDDVHRFYMLLLAELGVLTAISGLVALLAHGMVSLLAAPTPADRPPDEPGEPAGRSKREPENSLAPLDVEPARTDQEALIAVLAHVLGTGVVAMLVYLLLVDSQPAGAHLPAGPILRGQVLFALVGGFFAGALIMHQLFPTRNPWRLVLSVPATAAICYLLTIFLPPPDVQKEGWFAYQPPMRISAILPIDFFGLALPAVMAGFFISYRLIQSRRELAANANAAEER